VRSTSTTTARRRPSSRPTISSPRYCGVPAHQELAERATESPDEEPVVAEAEPELEALADELPPDAEAVGPGVAEPGDEPLESEAPADAAATHGPPATVIADVEDEVDLDVTHPQVVPPEEVPAGIPVEPVSHNGGDETGEGSGAA
jgi:hypothetical protein